MAPKRHLTPETKIKISIHQILHSKKAEKGKIKPKDSRREKMKIIAELNRHKRGRCEVVEEETRLGS